MRISDWSSDVCSSDLARTRGCRSTSTTPAASGWCWPTRTCSRREHRLLKLPRGCLARARGSMESVLPKRQWRARIAPVPCRTCTGRGRCMELLTLEHFSGHVNDTFSAVLNDDEVPFQLVEAR